MKYPALSNNFSSILDTKKMRTFSIIVCTYYNFTRINAWITKDVLLLVKGIKLYLIHLLWFF